MDNSAQYFMRFEHEQQNAALLDRMSKKLALPEFLAHSSD